MMPLCRICDNWVDEPVTHPVDCRHLRHIAQSLPQSDKGYRMTIGTDEERELIERGRSYGSSIAPYTADGDTVLALADALQSRIAEVARLEEALPIFKRVTTLARNLAHDAPTTAASRVYIQAAYDQLAALQQRNQNESGHTSQE